MVSSTRNDESLKRTIRKTIQKRNYSNRRRNRHEELPITYMLKSDKDDEIYQILLNYVFLLSCFSQKVFNYNSKLSENINVLIEDEKIMIKNNKGKFKRHVLTLSENIRKIANFIKEIETQYNQKMYSRDIEAEAFKLFNYR